MLFFLQKIQQHKFVQHHKSKKKRTYVSYVYMLHAHTLENYQVYKCTNKEYDIIMCYHRTNM